MLEWVKILKDLTEEERQNLELFCQEKFISKWEVLFREWDEATSMYILKTGSFKVTKNISWVEKTIWEVVAEETLWEMALFWKSWKRMATATALEDSVLITILSFSIKELTNKKPELLEKIKSIIEIRNMQNKMMWK